VDKIQMGKLLVQISALDNRQVTPATIEMWHRVNGDLEFADCEEAIPRAFQTAKDYLSPQMLRAVVRQIREERKQREEHEKRVELESVMYAAPQPKCVHDLLVTKCDPCCVRIAERALTEDGRSVHAWATANVYKGEK
jgi:hypothetical protein